MQGCREPQKLPWDGLLGRGEGFWTRGKVGKLRGKGVGCVGDGADSVGGAKLVEDHCAGAWGEGIDEQI